MATRKKTIDNRALLFVSVLQALLKGFSVFYFLLLPILFASKIITAEQLGYIGALLIAGILFGALAVGYRWHTHHNARLLKVALLLLFGSTLLLLWPANTLLLAVAYILIGLATGVGMSAVNALAARFTTQGKRYKALAKIAMLTDITRIAYPIIASGLYVAFGFVGLVYFALVTVVGFAICMHFLVKLDVPDEPTRSVLPVRPTSLKENKPFWFVIGLEFVDSFASSQLFVFLPTLLIFRGFSIESALLMQSAVFLGYLSGRWLIGLLAHRLNGYRAVGYADAGMVIVIIILLSIPPSNVLYMLSFMLGLFARGTSPVIKALAFDRLKKDQIRRGSAVHVLGGDSGSALGQLVFGFLVAWVGVTAPFIVATVCAAGIAIACLSYRGASFNSA